MTCRVTLLPSPSLLSRDIHRPHGAQPGVRHGRRRRHCQWAAAARARAAQRVAAPCSATTPARAATNAASGTGTTGFETHHTARHRTLTARPRVVTGIRGASRGCCTQASGRSLSASSFISSALVTRGSKRRLCGWWVHRSSSPDWRVACCASPSVYSPSPAADGGPTTRRAEDCPEEKARRCRWRAARARGRARRSARPRGGWTRPPATCPASPAARRTRGCAGIVLRLPRRRCRTRRPRRSRRPLPPSPRSPRPPPAARRRETSPSPVPTTRASSYSAPLSCDPSPAINVTLKAMT
ncbi:uncharacterized protein LOC134791732 isoform X3 [Cydia splendana]|uniref:uncharacterized protein LOC134791732 isoform X3 n=1 Tax=Cydia splendana TaxID=1100963 RepID=UPI00300CC41F